MSVCRTTSPSVILTTPTVCLSPHMSVALSVRPTASPSVFPTHPSYEPSVHLPVTPPMTRQSATPPVSLAKRPSDHPPPSHRLYDATISPSACPSPAVCLTSTMTHPPVCPSDTIPTKNGRELVEKWVVELMTNF